MKFTLHEIKLWFKNQDVDPKSYHLLPNKVNVITGDSTKGKTSFWNIIDYCLLSGKVTIPTEIIQKVLWFGIRFTINEKETCIIRKTPEKGAVSSKVYFGSGNFPDSPMPNRTIAEIRTILDEEFGINDNLRFPYGKDLGKTPFNVSCRHFLIFISLTQTIIDAPETYFDTTFYGKEEYDKALSHIFDLVIGVNDMENIKAKERLDVLENELKKIQSQERKNQKNEETFRSKVFELINWCKNLSLLEYSEEIEDVDEAVLTIGEVVKNTKTIAQNTSIFSEIDSLYKNRHEIQSQINAITQYQKEYEIYKRNLNKSADSLQPIEYLNQKLSDPLLDSYETKVFTEYLGDSLRDIKNNLSKKTAEPLKVEGDAKELKGQLQTIEKRIQELNVIKKNYLTEGQKFIELGKIEYILEQILKDKTTTPIDSLYLNQLNEEKERLISKTEENFQIKSTMGSLLNESIQRYFNQLSTLQTYKNSTVQFDSQNMLLQLIPDGEMFPLENIGSASNYMFLHLCLYLGLHEHIMNLEQENVPPFLFIDQPSTPYYEGKNDDREKLMDAFNLLNSFIEYTVNEKKTDFQIFMIEHASKDHWTDNNLTHFHTVDEFINGKGLIPDEIYNS
jgi:hypothetical protein